jgi:hypothetical protein
MREDTRGDWAGGYEDGALEVLKAWCEVRTGKALGPSDVVEERIRLCPCSAEP